MKYQVHVGPTGLQKAASPPCSEAEGLKRLNKLVDHLWATCGLMNWDFKFTRLGPNKWVAKFNEDHCIFELKQY